MLDLGTGSGILSIAAKLLGAHRAEAYDFDANAVRIARQNARANKARGIKFRRVDVTRWQPAQKYDVLAANLYSEMLIAVSAKIAEAVRPGGRLVISGILRGQEKKCLAAFRRRGFRIDRVVRHGKWSAALATGRGDS
jgi:ribosomal protein L11 methyltransferase